MSLDEGAHGFDRQEPRSLRAVVRSAPGETRRGAALTIWSSISARRPNRSIERSVRSCSIDRSVTKSHFDAPSWRRLRRHSVIKSGLITIITGLPSESLARTRKDEGMMVMSLNPALVRSFRASD